MMKSFCAVSVFIFLTSLARLSSAQDTSVNKSQTNMKTTGKVATKIVSIRVTENDYSIDEFAKFNAYVKKHQKTIPGLNGYVSISFTTEKDGSITHAKIEKGLTKAADEEALRLIRSYPNRWEPNTIDGKPRSGKIITSIVFGKIRPITNTPK